MKMRGGLENNRRGLWRPRRKFIGLRQPLVRGIMLPMRRIGSGMILSYTTANAFVNVWSNHESGSKFNQKIREFGPHFLVEKGWAAVGTVLTKKKDSRLAWEAKLLQK